MARKLSIAHVARHVGLSGVNPGGTLRRIEHGSRLPDADMIARIEAYTRGAVTAGDMHATRLDWLRVNRPEKFDGEFPAVAPSGFGFASLPKPGPDGLVSEAAE